jgi:hypothetical protein
LDNRDSSEDDSVLGAPALGEAGAQKQFLAAPSLDLSASDKRALEHWIKHG